jgi:type II secretory pathway pseudopilin PulG
MMAPQIREKMEELAADALVAPVKEFRGREKALEKEKEEEGEELNEKGEETALIKTLPSWATNIPKLAEQKIHVLAKWEDEDVPNYQWNYGEQVQEQKEQEQPQQQEQEQQQQLQEQPQQQISPGYAPSLDSPGYAPSLDSPGYAPSLDKSIQPILSPETPIQSPPPLPSGWSQHTSKKGIPYYFNEKTGESVWNLSDIPIETQTILTEVEEEPTQEEKKATETANETKKINM